MVSIIVARARNGMIGKENDFPWHLSSDLKHFRALTIGKTIIMGRGNYDHLMLRIGKMLPGRTSIVVTRNPNFSVPGVIIAHSFEEALQIANADEQEIFVVGGAKLYAYALPFADKIYMTEVDAEFDGDAFFPALDKKDWQEVSRESHPKDDKNQYPFSWVTLVRQEQRAHK